MSLITIVDTAFQVLTWLIIARALLSFFPHDPEKPVWRFIYEVTEPMLRPFRRFSMGSGGFGLDFSPLIAIFLLGLIRTVLISFLARF